jgi:hypothetical protein
VADEFVMLRTLFGFLNLFLLGNLPQTECRSVDISSNTRTAQEKPTNLQAGPKASIRYNYCYTKNGINSMEHSYNYCLVRYDAV